MTATAGFRNGRARSVLRRKIDEGRAPMIHTVRGLGYALRPGKDGR